MTRIIITEKDIKEAKTYMPISIKETMARLMAKLCLENIENPQSTEIQPLPGMSRENRMLRQQMTMGVLAQWYLGREIAQQKISFQGKDGKTTESTVNFCVDVATFDNWAESHVMNQLERLKQSKTEGVRNKVFDLLFDLRCFENMLFGAIRDELEVRNDPCGRISQMMNMQASPETFEKALEVLRESEAVMKARRDGHE